jgi:hypothetical protein
MTCVRDENARFSGVFFSHFFRILTFWQFSCLPLYIFKFELFVMSSSSLGVCKPKSAKISGFRHSEHAKRTPQLRNTPTSRSAPEHASTALQSHHILHTVGYRAITTFAPGSGQCYRACQTHLNHRLRCVLRQPAAADHSDTQHLVLRFVTIEKALLRKTSAIIILERRPQMERIAKHVCVSSWIPKLFLLR